MAGGLVQLVTSGTMDLTLTGNPEITFFNIIYRRHTNFGAYIKKLDFDNDVNFDSTSIITIPKIGQLLSKLVIKIELPNIDFSEINKVINLDNQFYFDNYNTFITFLNKMKNIIQVFFKNNYYKNGDYVKEFSNFVLKYLNVNDFNNFFISISSFIDNINENTNFLLYSYYNASLFKISDASIKFIYENWDKQMFSYEVFKGTIYENISILDSLNEYIYKITLNNTSNKNLFKISWIEDIAINLFDKIDLFIGSNKINSLSNFYIKNYGELYYENKQIYNDMIGKEIDFSNNLKNKTVYLVIPFWYNKNYGLSIPVVSNHFNAIQVKTYIKKFEECIKIKVNYENNTQKYDILKNIIENYHNQYNNINFTMLAECIYLDNLEAKKFATSSHEYLITQIQQQEFNNITTKGTYGLNFYHCCKDLYWNIVKKFEIDDIFIENFKDKQDIYSLYYKILYDPFYKFNINQYITSLINIINSTESRNIEENISLITENYTKKNFDNIFILNRILINSTVFCDQNSNFYRYLHPYIYYNSFSQNSNTNVYSFCLKPTEFQPSGTINFTKIPTISILSIINEELKPVIDKYKLIITTSNYNILRFIGGVVGLAYTYNF